MGSCGGYLFSFSSPKHGMAFCDQHCKIVEDLGYNTKLRDFLRQAGADDSKFTKEGQKKV